MRHHSTRAISFVCAALTVLMMVGGTVITIVDRQSPAEADIGSLGAYLVHDAVARNIILGALNVESRRRDSKAHPPHPTLV